LFQKSKQLQNLSINIDGFVKSRYCSLRDHLGAFLPVPLNFKNLAQAPQTVWNF